MVMVAAALGCSAGAALAQPFPGGLPACLAELNTCHAGLGTCTTTLDVRTTDLGTCATDLNTCHATLAGAQQSAGLCLADLNACDAGLGTCTKTLDVRTTDLGTCATDLNTCHATLAGAQQSAGLCLADLNACGANLEACTTDLSTCHATPAAATTFSASGQTSCWNGSGVVIPCAGTGQDGDTQAGAPLSYTDNGDGTITDNRTGLMWEKKVAGAGTCLDALHAVDAVCIWSDATGAWISAVNAEGGTGYAGYNDWRVPNVRELMSIVDYGLFSPVIDPIFGPTAAGTYWSSTSVAPASSGAWFVSFFFGDVDALGKVDTLRVRAVRGGR